MRTQFLPACRRLAALCALALPAAAQTVWHVDLTNPTPPGTGTAADPYTSVQYAIAQATTVDGDIVQVAPGTYFESIDFLGKELVVGSSGGSSVTFLDGSQGTDSVVTVASGEPQDTMLSGFTVRGGSGTFDAQANVARGGGIYCAQSALRVQDCDIVENGTLLPGTAIVKGSGGGVYAGNGASLIVISCTFQTNQASEGGALWVEQSSASVFFSSFTDNMARTQVSSAPFAAGRGGAIGAVGSSFDLDSSIVQLNQAEALQSQLATGGGLYLQGGTASVLNCQIYANAAGMISTGAFRGQGGGIAAFAAQPQDIQIGNCEIVSNLASAAGGGILGTCRVTISSIHENTSAQGAGVCAHDVEVMNSDIWLNFPVDLAAPVAGLGVFVASGNDALVTGTKIRDHSGTGEGIGAWGGRYDGCEIYDNHATGTQPSRGAGAFQATLVGGRVHHNTALQGGVAPQSQGGGLAFCDALRTVVFANQANAGAGAYESTLAHCTVEGNAVVGSGSGGGAFGGTATNSILWNNQPEDLFGGTATWSDVGTGAAGVGNLAVDPQLWLPAAQDFFLRPTSPCIDAGDPASPDDPDGSRADMGALPFYPSHYAPPFPYCTAKANSLGCLPSIGSTNAPTFSGGGPLLVWATKVLNKKSGILFWGAAPAAFPFQGGTLCVAPPLIRTAVQQSGGSASGNDCSGAYSFQWTSAYAASVGLAPGDRVFAQYWSRDPGSPSTTGLTNAIDITFIP